MPTIASQDQISESRIRRHSVIELERMLSIGRRVLLGGDAKHLSWAYNVPIRHILECRILAEAEERGCLATSTPLTVPEAMIAAGIDAGKPLPRRKPGTNRGAR